MGGRSKEEEAKGLEVSKKNRKSVLSQEGELVVRSGYAGRIWRKRRDRGALTHVSLAPHPDWK